MVDATVFKQAPRRIDFGKLNGSRDGREGCEGMRRLKPSAPWVSFTFFASFARLTCFQLQGFG
jgi:hypothetical protein